MFDIAPSEFLLVAFVALVVIGPKDLPKAMRVVGYWVGKARGVARQFRSGFDSMVREAELEEMEKRWASENERIMREHPRTGADVTTSDETAPDKTAPDETAPDAPHAALDTVDHAADTSSEPVMVEKPVVAPAAPSMADTPPARDLFDERPDKPDGTSPDGTSPDGAKPDDRGVAPS